MPAVVVDAKTSIEERTISRLGTRLRTRLGIQIVPASGSSSKLSSHQTAPAGAIARSGPHFHQALFLSFLSSFVSPLLPSGLGFFLPRGHFRRLSCYSAGLLCVPYGFAWYYSYSRTTLRVFVFLDFVYWLALTFANAPGPLQGPRGMAMARASLVRSPPGLACL